MSRLVNSSAYEEGKHAFTMGLSLSDNPHGGAAAELWRRGWMHSYMCDE